MPISIRICRLWLFNIAHTPHPCCTRGVRSRRSLMAQIGTPGEQLRLDWSNPDFDLSSSYVGSAFRFTERVYINQGGQVGGKVVS
jgi:hypothetical protein